MKKNSSGVVWGILLILGGIAIGGKVLNWFDFDLFFSGWWTLFIIIPSAVRFLTERGERISALKGLCLGLMLLMAAQGFIEFGMFIPLMIAAFLVLKGLRMLQPEKTKDRRQEEKGQKGWEGQGRMPKSDYVDAAQYQYEEEYDFPFHDDFFNDAAGGDEQGFEWNQYADRQQYRRERGSAQQDQGQYHRGYGGRRQDSGYYQFQAGFGGMGQNRRNGHCVCTSVLSGKEICYSQEVFDGAMLSCVLGAIDLDLTDAVMYQDTVIEAKAFLGGIDIIVPKDVRVVVKGTPILGGVDNRVKRDAPPPPGAVTVFINATCVCGGIEIKTKNKKK